jgi:hypothetical protein
MDALPLTPSRKIKRGDLRETIHTMLDSGKPDADC